MSKGIPALTYLPKIQIVVAAGSAFSTRALKAALNEVAQMQVNETPVGAYPDVRCLADSPYTVAIWDITKTAGSTKATGTVTLAAAQAGDTVTINGLVYTAVAGVKADNTQFSISGSNDADAADLAASITADTRTGTLADVTATSTGAVVTATSSLEGTDGNATTLVSSNGTRLAVSGAGTFTGGVDSPDYTLSYVSEAETTVVASIGRPALAERRLLDISIAIDGFDFTVRSAQAALNYIEKFEDKVASTGSGTALDGTYTNQPVGGPTPYEDYLWNIEKADDVYVLTPTVNS